MRSINEDKYKKIKELKLFKPGRCPECGSRDELSCDGEIIECHNNDCDAWEWIDNAIDSCWNGYILDQYKKDKITGKILIKDGETNGEMLKRVFPNIVFGMSTNGDRFFTYHERNIIFTDEW